MSDKPKLVCTFAGLICVALASMPHGASAVTAEVAKKCSALTAKVFPPRVIGNPGAGSAKGGGLAEQAYFRKCLAGGGKVEDDESHE
jgi:histidine ammonia-lyase